MCLCCQKDQEDQVRRTFIVVEAYCDVYYPFELDAGMHSFPLSMRMLSLYMLQI